MDKAKFNTNVQVLIEQATGQDASMFQGLIDEASNEFQVSIERLLKEKQKVDA